MAARAIWKGQLKIGTTKVPVKLYSAVQDRTVRFNILDDRNKMRVKQHMIDPDSGEEVASEEIQKGYEVEPGKFVILTEEDLEKIEPPPSRDIEILEFVPQNKISEQWYDRPYYLGPDGDEKEYFALVEALKLGSAALRFSAEQFEQDLDESGNEKAATRGAGPSTLVSGKVFRWHKAGRASGSRSYEDAGNAPFYSNIAFADGHVALMSIDDLVDPKTGGSTFRGGVGFICRRAARSRRPRPAR